VAPLLVTLALAAPVYILRDNMPAWKALVVGFVLFNVLVIAGLGLAAYVDWDWVAGLVWFMLKAFTFVFVFVWMRGTFPRVRIDQLMGFAWKWLLPAALLNLFITAFAIVILKSAGIH
jgi:NADH:ubiquinone oxidoreductase subunit H